MHDTNKRKTEILVHLMATSVKQVSKYYIGPVAHLAYKVIKVFLFNFT